MGRQIYKQPDGKFAVYSTIVDAFIITDAAEDEIVEFYATEAADLARMHVRSELDFVVRGAVPFGPRLTWEQALANHKRTVKQHDPSRARA